MSRSELTGGDGAAGRKRYAGQGEESRSLQRLEDRLAGLVTRSPRRSDTGLTSGRRRGPESSMVTSTRARVSGKRSTTRRGSCAMSSAPEADRRRGATPEALDVDIVRTWFEGLAQESSVDAASSPRFRPSPPD